MMDVTGKQTVNKPFGQPMYSVYSTATSGGVTTNTTTPFSFNTYGMGRTPYYSAGLSEDVPLVVRNDLQLQASVADVLRRSTALQALTPLRVRVDNGTVFLEGSVASAKQKRLAENLIGMTRGVNGVVNNIEVSEALPQPKSSPLGP
jgi:hypothetical protein